MADKYLELVDGVITEREVITESRGHDDAGKLIGLGPDGRLDIFMMSKDVATTLNPADHGALLGLGDDDHTQYVLHTEVDDVPVDGVTTDPISSNWAFDHVAAADPHAGYRLESADHSHQSTGLQAGQLDHGLAMVAASLLDDDHTQYVLRTLFTEQGDIAYRNATIWAALAHGTAGQVLITGGHGADPSWSSAPTITFSNANHTHQAAATGGQLDHGLALTGLGDDDHAQYPLLAGRAGGQTLIGGTGVTDVLSLQGTSGNGTSTEPAIKLLVGNNGGTTALTVLNSGAIGIGTATPLVPSDVEILHDGGNVQLTMTCYQPGGIPSPGIVIRSARGSLAIPSALQTGDVIFRLAGRGYGATAMTAGAKGRIDIFAGENWTDAAQGTYLTLSTVSNGSTSLTERFRIDTAGNVGINDPAPAEMLDVNGNINTTGVIKVDDVQVVSNQGAHVADATDAASVITQLNLLLTRLETHGLLAAA